MPESKWVGKKKKKKKKCGESAGMSGFFSLNSPSTIEEITLNPHLNIYLDMKGTKIGTEPMFTWKA